MQHSDCDNVGQLRLSENKMSNVMRKPAFCVCKIKGRDQMSRIVRKPAFCKCQNKDADQLRGNREADQHLCFCYSDSMIPLLPK